MSSWDDVEKQRHQIIEDQKATEALYQEQIKTLEPIINKLLDNIVKVWFKDPYGVEHEYLRIGTWRRYKRYKDTTNSWTGVTISYNSDGTFNYDFASGDDAGTRSYAKRISVTSFEFMEEEIKKQLASGEIPEVR